MANLFAKFLVCCYFRKDERVPPKETDTKGSPKRGYFLGESFMRRERGAFRNLARSAKERLAGNFWVEMRSAKLAEVEKARLGGISSGEAMQQFLTCVKSKVIRTQEFDPAEEQLYEKVSEVLCKTMGANPLAAVLDRDYMQELGDSERERYVFKLSERVKACVQRYEQEKAFAI